MMIKNKSERKNKKVPSNRPRADTQCIEQVEFLHVHRTVHTRLKSSLYTKSAGCRPPLQVSSMAVTSISKGNNKRKQLYLKPSRNYITNIKVKVEVQKKKKILS